MGDHSTAWAVQVAGLQRQLVGVTVANDVHRRREALREPPHADRPRSIRTAHRPAETAPRRCHPQAGDGEKRRHRLDRHRRGHPGCRVERPARHPPEPDRGVPRSPRSGALLDDQRPGRQPGDRRDEQEREHRLPVEPGGRRAAHSGPGVRRRATTPRSGRDHPRRPDRRPATPGRGRTRPGPGPDRRAAARAVHPPARPLGVHDVPRAAAHERDGRRHRVDQLDIDHPDVDQLDVDHVGTTTSATTTTTTTTSATAATTPEETLVALLLADAKRSLKEQANRLLAERLAERDEAITRNLKTARDRSREFAQLWTHFHGPTVPVPDPPAKPSRHRRQPVPKREWKPPPETPKRSNKRGRPDSSSGPRPAKRPRKNTGPAKPKSRTSRSGTLGVQLQLGADGTTITGVAVIGRPPPQHGGSHGAHTEAWGRKVQRIKTTLRGQQLNNVPTLLNPSATAAMDTGASSATTATPVSDVALDRLRRSSPTTSARWTPCPARPTLPPTPPATERAGR